MSFISYSYYSEIANKLNRNKLMYYRPSPNSIVYVATVLDFVYVHPQLVNQVVLSTFQKVDAVLQSSLSILRSARLKKAFEVRTFMILKISEVYQLLASSPGSRRTEEKGGGGEKRGRRTRAWYPLFAHALNFRTK